MLGAMACRVFHAAGWEVVATQRRDPAVPGHFDARAPVEVLERDIRSFGPADAVVNCIGITRVDAASPDSIEEAFAVNGVFPWKLGFAARACGLRVLHVSSDGVFRGRTRPYSEGSACDASDLYGLSKRAGEAALPNVLSVRTSIIGPAPGGQGLLEWFLRHQDRSEVAGYTNHVWNGVTTAQLSRFLMELAPAERFDRLRGHGPVVHFAPNRPLSKFELLVEINAAYGRDVRVRPTLAAVPVTRVLSSRFRQIPPLPKERGSITDALRELARCAPIQGKSPR
jgi:dTDP-4-dehydrorhamnose reductase